MPSKVVGEGGYTVEHIWYYYDSAAITPGSGQAIYRCLGGVEHFASPRSDCEGQVYEGLLGYLAVNDPLDGQHVRLKRCLTNSGDHFVSTDPNCEGQTAEGWLGWASRYADDGSGAGWPGFGSDGGWPDVGSVDEPGPFGVAEFQTGNCTIFHPQGSQLNASPFLHPIVAWGPGTGDTSENSRPFLQHLASHGFIVAGSNDRSSGSGQTMMDCINRVVGEHRNSSSILFEHVDASRICAAGYSQGGAGALMVGANQPDVDCTLLIHPYVFGALPFNQEDPVSVAGCFASFFLFPGCGFGHWDGYDPAVESQQPGPTLMMTGALDMVTWNVFSQNPLYIWNRHIEQNKEIMWAENRYMGINELWHGVHDDLGPYRTHATAFLRDVLMDDDSHDASYRGGDQGSASFLATHPDWDTAALGSFWSDD